MIKMNKEKINNNIKYIFIILSFLEIIIIKFEFFRYKTKENVVILKNKIK